MSIKKNRTVECPHCDKKFRGNKGLKMHIANEHSAGDLMPHRYNPSIMHMGDCVICGNDFDAEIHNIGETK